MAALIGSAVVAVLLIVLDDDGSRPAAAEIEPVVMRYRPTWLDNDRRMRQWAEVSRRVEGGSQFRSWTDSREGAGDSTHVELILMPATELPAGEPVMVGTAKGSLVTAVTQGTTVAWQVSPDEQLRVIVWGSKEPPDPPSVAVDIARSVVPDGQSLLHPPARFGWLPDGSGPGSVQVDGRLPGDVAVQLVSSGDHRIDVGITSSGPSPDQYLGEPVPVRGAQGLYQKETSPKQHAGPPVSRVLITLDDGRWVSASGQVDRDVLVRVLNTLDIAPPAAHPWIGSR